MDRELKQKRGVLRTRENVEPIPGSPELPVQGYTQGWLHKQDCNL